MLFSWGSVLLCEIRIDQRNPRLAVVLRSVEDKDLLGKFWNELENLLFDEKGFLAMQLKTGELRTRPKLLVLPLSTGPGPGFYWPELELRQSDFGLGVFAKTDLRRGLFFPLLGEPITQKEQEQRERKGVAQYMFQSSAGDWFDGRPQFMPFQLVGSLGLAAMLMVNEPPSRVTANCAFNQNSVEVCRAVSAGEELFVHYGDRYLRDYKVGRRRQHSKEPKGTAQRIAWYRLVFLNDLKQNSTL